MKLISFLLHLRLVIIFVSALVIFLTHYLISGQAVYGDGIGYYAHLHSWYFDHNWDSTNEYQHIYTPENNNALNPIQADHVQIISVSSRGRANNQFSPGSALFLLPFYVLADLISLVLLQLGIVISRTGYSDLYQILTGIGVISWSVVAFYLTEKLLKILVKTNDQTIFPWVSLLMFFSTHLLFYMGFDVIKSHFASYLLSVVFFYLLFLESGYQKWWHSLSLGLVSGLATITRPQDGLLTIIYLIWWLWFYQKINLRKLKSIKVWQLFLKEMSAFVSGFVIVVSIMVYQWSTLYYSIFEHQNLQDIKLNLARESFSFWGSLFHPQFGFITQTPIVGMALVFIFIQLFRKKIDSRIWLMIIFFILNFFVITVHGGWAVAAFGGRMYSSSLVLIAWGLAEMFKTIKTNNRQAIIIFLFFFFTSLNLYNLSYFILYGKNNEAGKKGTEERTIQRIQKLKQKFKLE